MKKIIISFIITLSISFSLVGCSKEVTDEELSLNLSLNEQDTAYTGKYTGTLVDNIPNGKGKFTVQGESDDDTWYYEGDFTDGHFSGEGKRVFDKKNIRQDGTYANDKLNGYGKRFVDDVLVYEGEFKDDKRNGNGKAYDLDGSILYEGEFKDNKRNGNGKLYAEDGSILYEGEFKDDKQDGNGKAYLYGYLIYEGEFKDDKRNGNGKAYDLDGSILYEGEFRNNEPN